MNNIGTIQLETERLILRRFNENDYKGMYDNWASDLETNKYVSYKPRQNYEETKQIINDWISEYENGWMNWVVELKENHEIIGNIEVIAKSKKHNNCEIGYTYGSKFWGKGYATEVLKKVIEFLLFDCDFHLVEARQYFVNKYTLHTIMNMSLDNFVIGRADIDNEGRDSFCYLLERSMQNLGQMRGSFVSKFGVWYSKDDNEYKFTKKYGDNLTDAFEKLKQEICFLLVSANNNNYEDISKCEIANIFKGKILSTYYPEKYLCIFDEEDVNKFLNILDIKYDILEINTLEKKKMLLQKFKETNKLLKDYSDYYFVCFLYKTFKNELKIKNTVTGEIDYNNIEFVDFDYLKRHETSRKNSYRSRETDYERINRNKKDVGNRGETAILQSEKNKLKSLGLNDLAEQVSICDNDAEGYDIISFDEHGNEIHIEVKTNSNNKTYLDFYITANELEHLMKDDKYYIYYLFNIKGKPRCHIINKKDILDKKQEFFQPVIYKVNIDVREKNKE